MISIYSQDSIVTVLNFSVIKYASHVLMTETGPI